MTEVSAAAGPQEGRSRWEAAWARTDSFPQEHLITGLFGLTAEVAAQAIEFGDKKSIRGH